MLTLSEERKQMLGNDTVGVLRFAYGTKQAIY